jgi:hypothetical protein
MNLGFTMFIPLAIACFIPICLYFWKCDSNKEAKKWQRISMYIVGFTLIGYNLFGFGLALMSWFIMNANGSEDFYTPNIENGLPEGVT